MLHLGGFLGPDSLFFSCLVIITSVRTPGAGGQGEEAPFVRHSIGERTLRATKNYSLAKRVRHKRHVIMFSPFHVVGEDAGEGRDEGDDRKNCWIGKW